MDQEQFKVLRTMSEATNRMDLNMFAKKLELSPSETMQQIQQLAKEGYLQKVGSGFGVTQKGKAALKILLPVPEGKGFQFYYELNQPADVTANDLEEFYLALKQIGVESIEFHLNRGDFENWFRDTYKDPEFAHEIGVLKISSLKREELRAEILKLLEQKFGLPNL